MVVWSQCPKSLDEGGLGLRDLREVCVASMVRRFWRLIKEDSLWSVDEAEVL